MRSLADTAVVLRAYPSLIRAYYRTASQRKSRHREIYVRGLALRILAPEPEPLVLLRSCNPGLKLLGLVDGTNLPSHKNSTLKLQGDGCVTSIAHYHDTQSKRDTVGALAVAPTVSLENMH